jgi:Uma2 family endonuclease
MSTIITTTVPAPRPVTIDSPYRMTVDEYERLIDAGCLIDSDKVELVDGILVAKMPKSPEHRDANKAVMRAFDRMLPKGWTWMQEAPVRIPDFNEPEPDFAVLAGTDSDYHGRHPGAADIGIVVEVSVTTLDGDRGRKRAAYAAAGIPVYWILDVTSSLIEVHTDPQAHAPIYRKRELYGTGELVPVVLDGNQVGEIAVDDILLRQIGSDGP